MICRGKRDKGDKRKENGDVIVMWQVRKKKRCTIFINKLVDKSKIFLVNLTYDKLSDIFSFLEN